MGFSSKIMTIFLVMVIGIVMVGISGLFVNSTQYPTLEETYTAVQDNATNEVIDLTGLNYEELGDIYINDVLAVEYDASQTTSVNNVAVLNPDGTVRGYNTTGWTVDWTNSDYSATYTGVDMVTDGTYIYVALDNGVDAGLIAQLNANDGTEVITYVTSQRPSNLSITNDGNALIYATAVDGDDVYILDITTTPYSVIYSRTISSNIASYTNDSDVGNWLCWSDNTASSVSNIIYCYNYETTKLASFEVGTMYEATYGSVVSASINFNTGLLVLSYSTEVIIQSFTYNDAVTVQNVSEVSVFDVGYTLNRAFIGSNGNVFIVGNNGTAEYTTAGVLVDATYILILNAPTDYGDADKDHAFDLLSDETIGYWATEDGYLIEVTDPFGTLSITNALEVWPLVDIRSVAIYDDLNVAPYDYEVSGNTLTFVTDSTDVGDTIDVVYTAERENTSLLSLVPIILSVALIGFGVLAVVKHD